VPSVDAWIAGTVMVLLVLSTEVKGVLRIDYARPNAARATCGYTKAFAPAPA
jgi:hypothetical protein